MGFRSNDYIPKQFQNRNLRDVFNRNYKGSNFHHRANSPNEVSIFVDNIAKNIDLQDLKKLFRSFGQLREVFISSKFRPGTREEHRSLDL
ncbi:hypothetical protein RND81_06G139600 [Saponaria officinalis]|uniref:RRM domain-containing protein n=1 Tax=Saponaria officinalis TaxID=3572 RepID=A0AAW1KAW9_SAPOF